VRQYVKKKKGRVLIPPRQFTGAAAGVGILAS